MGKWSDLLGELLMEIEGQLTLHVDKVRIRAVCLSWNSYLPNMMSNEIPSLLGVFENQNKSVALFNLIEQKYDSLYIPELQGKLLRGSSYGWVAVHEDIPDGWFPDDVYADDDDTDDADADAFLDLNIPQVDISCPIFRASSPDLYLINPFTGVKIRLPPRNTFPDVKEYCAYKVGKEYTVINNGSTYSIDSNYVHQGWLDKIVTSSSPLMDDCIVVAIYGELGNLAWCKCNDNSWTPIGGTEFYSPYAAYDDVIFYKDRLHALRTTGQLVVIENIGTNQTALETVIADAVHDPDHPYLVASSDGEGLLMVHQTFKEHCFAGFDVYKLNSETSCWCKVDNIGDDMLFLGIHSSSLSINAHRIPGYKGNCIYVADQSFGDDLSDDENEWKSFTTKVGVFNLADRTIEPLSSFESVYKIRWPAPIWVMSPN